jgi:DNA repair protein RecO (recombination protein O)
MYITTQGLVLRVSDYNDNDALLTLLTREHGLLTVKARGLRRKNSPLIAPCQLLAFGEFTLFEYRGMYSINEAHSIELFQGLRKDLVKLSLGTYFAQVAEVIAQEDIPNPELLSLVLNSLFALAKLSESENKVKAAFELRCACIAGYFPDLSSCHACGNEKPDRFDVSEGVLECSTCRWADSGGLRMPVTPGILESMRYITMSDSKRFLSFEASDETLERLAQITETYLTTQLERGFSTLDFYKSLLLPL